MMSKNRMKMDMLGQMVLILAAIIFIVPDLGIKMGNITLIVLGFWQLASATHLYLSYKYLQKKNFIKITLVVVLSMPIWMQWVGGWAYLPVCGLFLWYFYQTVRDWIWIKNRPLPFWQLKF